MTDVAKPSPSLKRASWLADPRLEGAAHLATAIAAIGAMISVIIGVVALRSQNRQFEEQSKQFVQQVAIQRELAISDRWQDHIRMSIQFPQFATADVDMSNLKADDHERYVWFAEDMIFASERILQYAPKDPQWVNTIKYEMRIKRPYVISDDFLGCPRNDTLSIDNCSTSRDGDFSSSYCTYEPELRQIIIQAFSDDAVASVRLKLAEARCHWDVPIQTVGIQPDA